MYNNWDIGIQEDFNNMTTELGRECLIYSRINVLTYESQEGEGSGLAPGIKEIVFLQELDSTHEMVQAGQMDVGDLRFEFLSDSIVEPECYVSPDEGITMYKILKITKVQNQSNNAVLYIKGLGKKVPNR